MAVTESEFRRRLAAALTGTGLAACGEQGPAVSAVLAEARAAGLKLAPERRPGVILECRENDIGSPYLALAGGDMWQAGSHMAEDLREAARRNNAFPALEARAARLAAALGELLAVVDPEVPPLNVERLRRAVTEGGEP